MKVCVYAGSFDPITNGHLWMIEEGAKLFDKLIVAVGTNPEKKYAFSIEERLGMMKAAVKKHSNIEVNILENQFLVNYAKSIGAQYILRGIRTEGDFQYERGMRHINSDIDSSIVPVFLIPPREIAEISSSFVKGLVGVDGWEEVVSKYVPGPVHEKIVGRFSKQ